MTDKPQENAADDAAKSAPGPSEAPTAQTPTTEDTAGIPAPPTEPVANAQTAQGGGGQAPPPPPVAQSGASGAQPKSNWWRDHIWTTVIGAALISAVLGLALGLALGFGLGVFVNGDDHDRGPGYHKRWDDRHDRYDRHRDRYDRDDDDRWGPRRGPGGEDGDWGRYYWDDDRGPRSQTPPWMRTPRPTTPRPTTPAPGQPTPGQPAPPQPAPGQPAPPQPTA